MNRRWVLDASAAVHLVMRSDYAPGLVNTLQDTHLVIAPYLYCAETANALWKYLSAGEIETDTAVTRHEEALGLIDRFERDDHLTIEALTAAQTHGHPVYDMLYAVLARRYGCAVLTMDKRLAGVLEKMEIEALHPTLPL